MDSVTKKLEQLSEKVQNKSADPLEVRQKLKLLENMHCFYLMIALVMVVVEDCVFSDEIELEYREMIWKLSKAMPASVLTNNWHKVGYPTKLMDRTVHALNERMKTFKSD